MVTYWLSLTQMEGRDKTNPLIVEKISGRTEKDALINAIRRFNPLRKMVDFKSASDEFGLSTLSNPDTDAWWIIKSKNAWLIRKYRSPAPGLPYGGYVDMYTMPNAKLNHPMAKDFMTKIKD